MHAISRLFFAVLYKRRYLLTWIISFAVCIPPFFIEGGYALEIESRSCVVTSKMYLLALYMTIVSCIIPCNIIVSVYLQIVFCVHRSTRRVWAFRQNMNSLHNNVQKSKREMKLMKQMVIQTGILISGGPIFLFLVGWHAFPDKSPPEPFIFIRF